MRLLIVTSVQAEADAVGAIDGATIVVSGVGRTNAAAATTESIIRDGPFDAALNVGIAGALPGSNLKIADTVLASRCVYVEEGLIGPDGFADMAALGFPLGDFAGNVVPVDESLIRVIVGNFGNGSHMIVGPIATVATCSGTDAAAREVVRRTGAIAEAMEGAAVVHAARRLGTPAFEVRTISNTTGDRPKQQWDRPLALRALREAVECAVGAIGSADRPGTPVKRRRSSA